VTWQAGLAGFLAGFLAGLLIALVTTPAGVSGAVPSPAVTPASLLFSIVAVPGALLRYRRSDHLAAREYPAEITQAGRTGSRWWSGSASMR
jgi:uncharacterized membrane protein YfcA